MKKISTQELKQKFTDKGINKTCESCGQNEWLSLTNFATLILQDSEAIGLSSYPVAVVECKNCGLLRFYSRERLLEE